MNIDEGLKRFGILVSVIIGVAGGIFFGYGFSLNLNPPREILKGVLIGFLCAVGIGCVVYIFFWSIRWIMKGFQGKE